MRFSWKREWLPLTLIGLSFLTTALIYPRLPDPMPVHWNVAGLPDNYAPRAVGAFLLPATTLATYLGLFLLPRIDPLRANVARFEQTYRLVRVGVTLVLIYLQALVLLTVIQGRQRLPVAMLLGGFGVFLIIVGNALPRVRPNWFVGIRTPWTLSSERVWRETHRFGGRLWVISGLLILLISLLLPGGHLAALLTILILAGLIPATYSYLRYRRERVHGEGEGRQQ